SKRFDRLGRGTLNVDFAMRLALAIAVSAFFMNVESTIAAIFPNLAELNAMAAKFAPTPLAADTSHLSEGDRQAVIKLIEAGRVVDELFMQQLWSDNVNLYKKLQTSPLGKARLNLFWIYKGPWSDLDEHRASLPDVPERKP